MYVLNTRIIWTFQFLHDGRIFNMVVQLCECDKLSVRSHVFLHAYFITIKCFQLNLDKPLEAQGPFTLILHKLTEIIAQTIQGNSKVREFEYMIQCEFYLSLNKF
jgi:hypothetical protein